MSDVSNDTAIATGTGTARTLASRFSDRYDVRDFGIVGSGGDEGALLQTAISTAAGLAPLLIPSGMTIVTSKMLSLPTKSHIILDGTIKLMAQSIPSGGYVGVIHITGSYVRIEGNGIIDGNKANISGDGLSGGLDTLDDGSVSDCYVSGITIQNCVSWPYNIVGVSRITAENCRFYDCGGSAEIVQSTDCHFLRCTADTLGDDGLGLYGGCNRCSIVDCLVVNCTCGPFVLSDGGQSLPCNDCIIQGNISQDCQDAGILITATGGIAAGQSPHRNIVAVNNLITSTKQTGNGYQGIIVNGVIGCLVSNNTISPFTNTTFTYGITISDPISELVVRDNVVGPATTTSFCIGLTGLSAASSGAIIVTGNFMFNNLTNGSGVGFGILNEQAMPAGVSLYIGNNTFSGKFSNYINDSSGTSIVENLTSSIQNRSQHAYGVAIGTPSITLGTPTVNGSVTGPTITSGEGAPANNTQPTASIYLRTDGAIGSHIYVCDNIGTWVAISGV